MHNSAEPPVAPSPRGGRRSSGADPAQTAPIWARLPAERRVTLTRASIVRAAMEIADAQGLAAVSIRRVAAALGVRAMSLYSHIERKEDLLDLMADEVAAEVLIQGDLPADWREAISAIARRQRAVFLRHPWVIKLPAGGHPRIGPNGLRHVEQSLAALDGVDVSSQDAWRILVTVDDYTLGYAIREVIAGGKRDATAQAERRTLMQPYFQRLLDSGEFPRLGPLIREGLLGVADNFEQGLRWLLDGITLELRGPTESPVGQAGAEDQQRHAE